MIDYLIGESAANNWKFIIADTNKEQILVKTKHSPFAEAVEVNIADDEKRDALIQRAHVVISMLPPALHFLVAKDCVENRKHLLTASYLDTNMKSLANEIKDRKLLFLCEMGLDPGIDHMSAMKLIDEIHASEKKISSFKSHCGGLIAPESDNNPWHYKISWNPRNVVLAGKAGATYKENNKIKKEDFLNLFSACKEVTIDGLGKLAYYPNRDSLGYIPIYKLETATTFIRTTLRYPVYCKGWNAIAQADLANEVKQINAASLTFKKWSLPIIPFVSDENKLLLEYLGIFDDISVPAAAKTSADILQYLVETKLAMEPTDKDMIVMLHEIEYDGGSIESSLVVKGTDHLRTAMAKTVGLPLGIAAKFILDGTFTQRGLHIPISKEVYLPVLKELEKHGIRFRETSK